MAGADKDRQTGKDRDQSSQCQKTGARSRSPSPTGSSVGSKMPKYKPEYRKHNSFPSVQNSLGTNGGPQSSLSTTGSAQNPLSTPVTSGNSLSTTGSTESFLSSRGSEDSGICSAVTSPRTPSQSEIDVFPPVMTGNNMEGISRITNGPSEAPETDAKIVKKRLSGLFKTGKHAAFKRQDSDLAYRIQNSHVTSVTNQNGLHSDSKSGSMSNSVMHRDLSIEEELQIRIEQVC